MSYPITITMPRSYFNEHFRQTGPTRAIRLDDLVEHVILKESEKYIRLGRPAHGVEQKGDIH